jgi:hypothetical protein
MHRTRVRLPWLIPAGCTDQGTLVAHIEAPASVRAAAMTVELSARSASGDRFVDETFERSNDIELWPVEFPIVGDAGPVEIVVNVRPYAKAVGIAVTATVHTSIVEGRTLALTLEARDGTFELKEEDLDPTEYAARSPNMECVTPPPFDDWLYFTNFDRGAGCVAFVDRIGCDLELIEDCTTAAPRTSWRGGIRGEEIYLVGDGGRIGCDGRIDDRDDRRVRFACLPRHLGLDFTRIDGVRAFAVLRDERPIDFTFAIEAGAGRVYGLQSDGMSVYDSTLSRGARITEGPTFQLLLVTSDGPYTVESGWVRRRDPETLELRANSFDLADVVGLYETEKGILAISGSSVVILRPNDLMPVTPIGELPAPDLVLLGELDENFYFLSTDRRAEILRFNSDLIAEEIEPLPTTPAVAASLRDGTAAFVAPCRVNPETFCYLEYDLRALSFRGETPLEDSFTPGPAGLGITPIDSRRALVYGPSGVHVIDRERFESLPDRRVGFAVDDLVRLDGELVALFQGGTMLARLVEESP